MALPGSRISHTRPDSGRTQNERTLKTYLINKAHVRAYALEISRRERCGKFTRVSEQFLDMIEAKTKAAIYSAVKSHPSIGITLK